MVREGIKLGPLFIHYYGVIIMLGALLAAWLTSRQAQRRGEKADTIWDMLPWLLVAGIVGARIWHILTPPDSMKSLGITTGYYLSHPLDAIAVWNGGLGIPGAVIGGLLAMYYYCRHNRLSFSRWIDFVAPGLAVAQAIGRWGNYINQEVYGAPTNLPWKIFIDEAHRIPAYKDVAYYHPLFLYESIYNLLNMGILLYLSRKKSEKLLDGDLFLIYLIIYAVGRFLLEFIRVDVPSVGTLDVNQTIMAVVALGSIAGLIWKHRSQKRNPTEIQS
jgi:phosphatidylglycerol---prolipoprotein diacylglyceryl transferase